MKLIFNLICFFLFFTSVQPGEFLCFDGSCWYDGEKVNLKGLNWYGIQNDRRVLQGLEHYSYISYLNFMSNYSFNAIR